MARHGPTMLIGSGKLLPGDDVGWADVVGKWIVLFVEVFIKWGFNGKAFVARKFIDFGVSSRTVIVNRRCCVKANSGNAGWCCAFMVFGKFEEAFGGGVVHRMRSDKKGRRNVLARLNHESNYCVQRGQG